MKLEYEKNNKKISQVTAVAAIIHPKKVKNTAA